MVVRNIFRRSVLFFLLLLSLGASAQSGNASVTDVSTSMLTWMKHLNNDADKYYSAEKAADLSQQLEFLRQDLTVYMKARKKLSDSLFRNNIAPGKKDPDNLEMLKGKMSTVMERLRGVADLVGPALQAEGDKLNEEIYNVLYDQPNRYLSNLEAFLGGMDVNKKELALDGSTNYSRLEECVNLATTLQGKIDRKRKK
ncbi:hypothetical protein [Chitinophaga arvensicola]|uniref:DUF4142 domain-containing protein n=1 Tax=Chitinophaga arvensicola TaxID=29529 RepID=A0A1I0S851_9BACT|nr:hypothetical protein [Chitinophaga arvensicola]SEW52168.1 hypothetical protein SAMN04488122_4706 [Chitinophaga arvensicola]